MKEVLSKLHKACEEAGNVKKGERVRGMHFNPLLADDVKAVAMKAFLNNKLYPVCNYETHINDGFVMIICNLTIYDIENPNQFIEVKGSSGYGKLDKYGTGNGMTYSQKYAFLAALNLKTGIKDEDGYNNVEPLIVETSKPTPKLHIFTNETVDNKPFNADEFVKEWIEKMTKQAQHSISQNAFEKGMQPLRENYAKELQLISTDLMQQALIDESENTLKQQITNRKK
jgi:hypothetical protein|tara:strand:+ start:185 stop:868 length:684 start_codon:yes stop_codon:yes gene_type:complete